MDFKKAIFTCNETAEHIKVNVNISDVVKSSFYFTANIIFLVTADQVELDMLMFGLGVSGINLCYIK